jgi:hypothetical protein
MMVHLWVLKIVLSIEALLELDGAVLRHPVGNPKRKV